MPEAREQCGSQRNSRQSVNMILVCPHRKQVSSFTTLCHCTLVPNSGPNKLSYELGGTVYNA